MRAGFNSVPRIAPLSPLGWHGPRRAASPAAARRASAAGKLLVFLISFLSFGNFNPAIIGTSDSLAETIQKLLVVSLWLLLIAATFLPGVQRRRPLSTGLLLPVLMLGFVVLSVSWSNHPASSAEKLVVLLMTTFGAWRLASTLQADDLFNVLTYSLAALILASLLLVFLVPSIGVLRTWQHAGQWSGIFISKQTLGTVAALLVFLSLLRLIHGASLLALAAFILGLLCVLGSGSRGGAVLAGAAIACVLVARRSPGLAAALTMLPIALLALACGIILFQVVSGLPYLPLFGERIDLTQRTLIWRYALEAWRDRQLFGFGINGLWADPDYYNMFLRTYGWVLDNYHSGYVSVFVEYGLAGMTLFAALVVVMCRRLGRMIASAPLMAPREKFGAEAMFGFVILCFTINLTETFFFRGTDFLQVTLTFVTILLFAAAPQAVHPAMPRPAVRRMRPG
jgi:O-antigen ligase